MTILTYKRFNKQFARLDNRTKRQFIVRQKILAQDPENQLLNIHPLHPPFEKGSLSMNVTGNYRAIFIEVAPDTILFTDIGTHHQLFGT